MVNVHALQTGLKKQVTFMGLRLSELWRFVLTKVKSASPCGAHLAHKMERDLPTLSCYFSMDVPEKKKMPGCCYVSGKGQFSLYGLFHLISCCRC